MAPTPSHAAQQTIDTLRTLAIDAIEAAKSGHPGLPLGAAPMAYVLWQKHLRAAGQDPAWLNRDRFVLSAGHGSMLLYGLLHLYGYDVTLEDLRAFRRLHSRTPGHPERGVTAGIEATTGPLGQGAANTVGMAMAERYQAQRYNKPGLTLIDHHTFALVSDGDIMEGVVHEAASLAGHLKLGRLIWLYDANQVTLDGPASLCFTDDTSRRFESYGWQVLHVRDGDHDVAGLDEALTQARAATDRPTLIVVHTTIGYGAPTKSGSSASHGAPLGPEEAQAAKRALGFDPAQSFVVPPAVRAHVAEACARNDALRQQWHALAAHYQAAHPAAWAQLQAEQACALPDNFDADLAQVPRDRAMSTREAGGLALNALARRMPNILGGDGDLSVSTLTTLTEQGDFDGATGRGRNIRFGVREHAMAAAINGLAYYGGLRPYAATFFVFSDYMRPSIRMAALGELAALFVFTHDSVGVGEDGATHQPIEQLASLRAMPKLTLLRPADVTETVACYRWAMAQGHRGPVAMVLGRQKLPSLQAYGASQADIERGAYIVSEAEGAAVGVVIATGSEVHLALTAQAQLRLRGIFVRVVSMPSWELFAAQSQPVQDTILPPTLRARVAVEAGSTMGWCRWVGERGRVVGLDGFGLSGPGPQVSEALGLHAAAVVDAMTGLLGADQAGS